MRMWNAGDRIKWQWSECCLCWHQVTGGILWSWPRLTHQYFPLVYQIRQTSQNYPSQSILLATLRQSSQSRNNAGWEVDANLFIGVLATNRDSLSVVGVMNFWSNNSFIISFLSICKIFSFGPLPFTELYFVPEYLQGNLFSCSAILLP